MARLSQLQGPHTYTFVVPAEATAANDDTWSVWIAPFDCTVVGVDLVPDANITANGTNYFTLDVQVGSTSAAQRSWAATNSTALTKESATLNTTTANRNFSKGDVVKLVRTHQGASGLASPRMTLQLSVQVR